MPLSQAISDTDCIMREYNQLTAAGSYGERMILNRNQYKLNLTLSLAEQSSELEIRGGEWRQAWGVQAGLGGAWPTPPRGRPLAGLPPRRPPQLPREDSRLSLSSPSRSATLPFLPFAPLLTACSISRGCRVDGAIFLPSLI